MTTINRHSSDTLPLFKGEGVILITFPGGGESEKSKKGVKV